ncbi:MAG TPA: FAD-binding oxidoreductase, partial [Thermoleophilaceae bacterium]
MSERLPASARAVVIGGGVAGASVACGLAREGWDELVLIDQGPLWRTGGSTSHAPGLVFQHNPSHTMTTLAGWTVELFSELGAYHAVGGIEVATNEERRAELDRRAARARGYGLDARLLSPDEVAERVPLIDPGAILGGFLVADDGIAKAVDACEAMAGEAIDRGALRAFGSCEATGLTVERGRVAGVETSLGSIRTEHVVIAAGIWGPRLARLVHGLNIPLTPVQHQLAYTAPLASLAG